MIALAILGLQAPKIVKLVPDMWKPVVEVLIEIVTS